VLAVLAPPATAGTAEDRVFRHPEITADDPAVAEHPGSYSSPKFPQKPDVPRKWDQWD
jgi:hypothetical protein